MAISLSAMKPRKLTTLGTVPVGEEGEGIHSPASVVTLTDHLLQVSGLLPGQMLVLTARI